MAAYVAICSLQGLAVAQEIPVDDDLATSENFAKAAWGASATASSFMNPYVPANVLDDNVSTKWITSSTEFVPATPAVLTVNLGGSIRLLDAFRFVSNVISGTRLPRDYSIETLENGIWVKRIDQKGNQDSDKTHYLPATIKATQIRLTITAVSAGGIPTSGVPIINSFEAYGPFAPRLATGLPGESIKAANASLRGTTQPATTVTFTPNGGAPVTAVSNANGWFALVVPLISGANSVVFKGQLGSISSENYTTTPILNTSLANFADLFDCDNANVTVKDGTNPVRLVVRGATVDGYLDLAIRDVDGNIVSSGSVNLANGSNFYDFPGDIGWYEASLTRSSVNYGNVSFSVIRNDFRLPSNSKANCDVAMEQIARYVTEDYPEYRYAASNYSGKLGFCYARERLNWPSVQSAPGVYNWSSVGIDADVDAQRKVGKKVLMMTYYAPACLNDVLPDTDTILPDNLIDTYSWGRELGLHFKGRVSAWEFQNELDWSAMKNSVNTLGAHHRAFYLGIKSADAEALVIPCPMAFIADVPNQIKNLRGEAYDAFNFHWYPNAKASATPSSATKLTDLIASTSYFPYEIKTMVNQVGSQAIWLTESGAWDVQSNNCELTPAAEKGQADYAAKLFPLSMALGIDRAFPFALGYWHNGDPANPTNSNNQYGFLRRTNYNPRPAASALAAASEAMRDVTFAGQVKNLPSNVRGYAFQRTDGTYVGAFWATGGTTYALPSGVTTTLVRNYLGTTTYSGSPTASLSLNTTVRSRPEIT